jgi:hypothetical protein
MSEIKAIETCYKGYRFRSRLEARWAVFFDALGIAWEYEKEGYDLGEAGWYLPDFFVPYPYQESYPNAGYWFEVKGGKPSEDELAKARALAAHTKHTTYVVWGAPGEHEHFWAHRGRGCGWSEGIAFANLPSPAAFSLLAVVSRWDHPGDRPLFDFHRALVAARSARFEHGESPRI